VTQRPTFRHISPPLDVDDGTLAKLADQMGVPTLVKPSPPAPAAAPEPRQEAPKPAPRPSPARAPSQASPSSKMAAAAASDRRALEKLTVELPGYLIDAIKRDALDRRATARHVLMLALQSAGFAIEPADLVQDARRTPRKTGNS
jgi:hypothetical protein